MSVGNLKVRVKETDGKLTTGSPVTVKSLGPGVKKIEDIGDVEVIDSANGATLVANNGTFEIRPILFDEIEGIIDLDFGTF
jgi:hypothetical protein